jgi:hypothetical protein
MSLNLFCIIQMVIMAHAIGTEDRVHILNKQRSNRVFLQHRREQSISDLLTFHNKTQFCGEEIYHILTKFCSYFGGLYFNGKRTFEYGIVDECCYRKCSG